MKKPIFVILLCAALALPAWYAHAQPASCLSITQHATITASTTVGVPRYTYTWTITNPTSGTKSIVITYGVPPTTVVVNVQDGAPTVYTLDIDVPVGSDPQTYVAVEVHVGIDGNGAQCNSIIVLPVRFTAITARAVEHGVEVAWTVAPESIEPGSSFTVERSTNARDFEALATVAAVETQRSYTYHDAPIASGFVFYRIRAESRYSRVVSVPFVRATLTYLVTPSTLYVAVPAGVQLLRHELFTPQGQMLQRGESASGTTEIPLGMLRPGPYFLRCVSTDGTSQVIRFQKW